MCFYKAIVYILFFSMVISREEKHVDNVLYLDTGWQIKNHIILCKIIFKVIGHLVFYLLLSVLIDDKL